MLEGKARTLKELGMGKKPNAAVPLTPEEEEELWARGHLGYNSPTSLVPTMWFLFTQQFWMRAVQEHTSMTVKDFKFVNGEYVEFLESLTKTRQGGLHHKQRPTNPKMFAIGGPRCLYTYTIFISPSDRSKREKR